MTKILRKTCLSLIKIISDGENNFAQNKYNKLQKISAKKKCFFAKNKYKSANMESYSIQLQGVDLGPDFRRVVMLRMEQHVRNRI